MFHMPAFSELIIIFAVLLLLFGSSKLPSLGKAFGESIKNFKKGIKDSEDESEEDEKERLVDEKKKKDSKLPPS